VRKALLTSMEILNVVFGRMVRTACNIEGEATKLDAILVLKVMRLDVQDN
jgi:hypothetical protein